MVVSMFTANVYTHRDDFDLIHSRTNWLAAAVGLSDFPAFSCCLCNFPEHFQIRFSVDLRSSIVSFWGVRGGVVWMKWVFGGIEGLMSEGTPFCHLFDRCISQLLLFLLKNHKLTNIRNAQKRQIAIRHLIKEKNRSLFFLYYILNSLSFWFRNFPMDHCDFPMDFRLNSPETIHKTTKCQ